MELIRVLYGHCRRKIGFVHRENVIFSIFKQEIKNRFLLSKLAAGGFSLFSLVRNIVLTWRVLYLENFKPSESDFSDKPARDNSLTNI